LIRPDSAYSLGKRALLSIDQTATLDLLSTTQLDNTNTTQQTLHFRKFLPAFGKYTAWENRTLPSYKIIFIVSDKKRPVYCAKPVLPDLAKTVEWYLDNDWKNDQTNCTLSHYRYMLIANCSKQDIYPVPQDTPKI
jgi:hypothetical protein